MVSQKKRNFTLKIVIFWGFENDNILSSKSNTVTKSKISPQRKLGSLQNLGAAHRLLVNSRKKRIVNPIKIEVTRRARTETILGKSPAIFNGHQPTRADYQYRVRLTL